MVVCICIYENVSKTVRHGAKYNVIIVKKEKTENSHFCNYYYSKRFVVFFFLLERHFNCFVTDMGFSEILME